MMTAGVPVRDPIVLTGAISFQSVEAIHAELLEMGDQPVIEIDCSGATEVDLSLIQLILAARVSAKTFGRTIRLSQPAAGALLATLERGGFLGIATDPTCTDQAFWLQPAEVQ
jgi:hypothetical protein